jgi:hypothetical protein
LAVIEAIQAELAPLGIKVGGRQASGGPGFISSLPHGPALIEELSRAAEEAVE